LATVGQRLNNFRADFDPRTYGSPKLSDLVRKTGTFDVDQSDGKNPRIRLKTDDKRKSAKPAKAGSRGGPVAD